MAINSVPSASVIAKAQQLLHERHLWSYVRNKETGVSFIAIPSGDHVYQVRPDGRGCSCKAAQLGNLVCSHRLAATERANHDALAPWTEAQQWETVYRACGSSGDRPVDGNRCPECEQAVALLSNGRLANHCQPGDPSRHGLADDGWSPIPEAEQRQAEAWAAECRAMPDAARNSGDEMWPENQDAF